MNLDALQRLAEAARTASRTYLPAKVRLAVDFLRGRLAPVPRAAH